MTCCDDLNNYNMPLTLERHFNRGYMDMDLDILRLFYTLRPYDRRGSRSFYLNATKRRINYFLKYSPEYRAICDDAGFRLRDLQGPKDLHKIPVIPTLYFKRNKIGISRCPALEVTSSGTGGAVSRCRYTPGELCLLAAMAFHLGRAHRLFSMRPVHYIMLGYQPVKENKSVISKTAYLSSWYAPAVSRTYALQYHRGKREGDGVHGAYKLNMQEILGQLMRFATGKRPVRLVGFPSYTFFLLRMMQQEHLECHLPRGSMVLLGGGWKQFSEEEIPKEELYNLIWEILGVEKGQVHEFFGAAEHPVLYCSCRNHHFHVPVYGKVLIRDVRTMKVLPKGRPGLVNLMTPIGSDIPLMSVMTDDIGVLRRGEDCGCGIKSDYLELLGRAKARGVKTCAAGAIDDWSRMMAPGYTDSFYFIR